MTSFFKFGILLAVIRIECFQLLVQQLPNPAYDHDNVTLSASYSGFEIIEYPRYLEWVIVSSLQSVGLILLPGCDVMGFMNISAYSFSCSEGEFTWTILNVSRYQHGQIWSCTFTNTKGKSVHAELALKLQVQVSAVQLTQPKETDVIETEHFRVLFECVSQGLPAPTIRWFMDYKTPNYTVDDVEYTTDILLVIEPNADNTYNVKSQLFLTLDRKHDGMEIYCTVNNTASVLISSRRPVIHVQFSHLFIENPVNCGEPAKLRCKSSSFASTPNWNFKLNGTIIVSNININSSLSYRASADSNGTITLLVLNPSVHDRGSYTCQISSGPESQPVGLEFECRPKAVEMNTRDDAKIQFVFDNVYPTPTEVFVTVFNQAKEEFTCGGVSCMQNDKGYYKCIWNSIGSFKKGTYTYVFDIKFITKEACFVGNFTIDVYPTSESLTLENTYRTQYSGPDLNLTCIYTGNRTVKTVSWYRNGTLVGAVSPSCEILTRPHFGRYQFVCPSPFETVLSVDQLVVNRALDRWTCRVGFGFGNVLESRPLDMLLEGITTEGSDQPLSNSGTEKVVGGVIGGFVTGLLVGIASVFLVNKMRVIGKCMAEKETTDMTTHVAAAHQQNDIELIADKTQTLEVENYRNDEYENSDSLEQPTTIDGEIRSYERLQDDLRENQQQYDVIRQY